MATMRGFLFDYFPKHRPCKNAFALPYPLKPNGHAYGNPPLRFLKLFLKQMQGPDCQFSRPCTTSLCFFVTPSFWQRLKAVKLFAPCAFFALTQCFAFLFTRDGTIVVVIVVVCMCVCVRVFQDRISPHSQAGLELRLAQSSPEFTVFLLS